MILLPLINMPEYLRQIDEEMHGAPIFIHRIGSHIDMNLADKLRNVDIRDGWVDRKEPRFKI